MKCLKASSLPFLAFGEWLLILPATVFLGAAALRLLQPRLYEPSHISWISFEWTTSHISRVGAAILFIALPAVVAVTGCATVFRVWRDNHGLRQDFSLAFGVLQRRLAVVLLATATLLAGATVSFAIMHMLTD